MNMKKIGILTHSLGNNYGGLLQAFALQKVLTNLGFNSEIISHTPSANIYYFWSKWNFKKIAKFILAILKANPTPLEIVPPFILKRIFFPFIKKNFKYSKLYTNQKEINSNYDYVIVGSDQVWKYEFTKSQKPGFFFLSFLSESKRKKSFSYSASFAINIWEGDTEITKKYSAYLKQFKTISVREHSGVDICRDTFGVSAVQMPDPTLLLTVDEYNAVIPEKVETPPLSYIGNYVLDSSPEIKALLSALSSSLQLPLHGLMPDDLALNPLKRLPMGVPQWLVSIRGASYMLTDSFHGCVFCIIYNIPFICLGSEYRGSARFDSLLKTFGLESRMVTDHNAENILALLRTPIDWKRVNAIRASERDRGLAFLKENLAD